MKLFLGIEDVVDCETLQRDIDNAVARSKLNFLEFNTSKCKTTQFTRSHSPHTYIGKISGVPLELVTQIRDLV